MVGLPVFFCWAFNLVYDIVRVVKNRINEMER